MVAQRSHVQLVSELTEPPVVGRTYLVPAIWMSRGVGAAEMWWPVHGSQHDDVEFFNFPHQHYHVDQRFLTLRHLRVIGVYEDIRGMGPIERSFATPVHGAFAHVVGHPLRSELPPEPQLRRMRCMREMPPVPRQFRESKLVVDMHAHFAGRTAKRGRLGLVCPHRQYPLGQCVPDASGVITCPLHGLRVRASDGVVVMPERTP